MCRQASFWLKITHFCSFACINRIVTYFQRHCLVCTSRESCSKLMERLSAQPGPRQATQGIPMGWVRPAVLLLQVSHFIDTTVTGQSPLLAINIANAGQAVKHLIASALLMADFWHPQPHTVNWSNTKAILLAASHVASSLQIFLLAQLRHSAQPC